MDILYYRFLAPGLAWQSVFSPVYCRPDEDGPPAANDPAEVTHEGHGGPLQDDLRGGEVDEVVVGEAGVVAVGPHVGDEVGVEVGITEEKMFLSSNCFISYG